MTTTAPEAAVVQTTDESKSFTVEQIADISGFFDLLRRIHTRMAIEGYEFTDEGVKPPQLTD